MTKDRNNPMYGRKHSLVSRALMSKVKTNVPKTKAHREAISAAMVGHRKTKAHRETISKGMLERSQRRAAEPVDMSQQQAT